MLKFVKIYIDMILDDIQCHIPSTRWCSLYYLIAWPPIILSANVFTKLSFDASILFILKFLFSIILILWNQLSYFLTYKRLTIKFGSKKVFVCVIFSLLIQDLCFFCNGLLLLANKLLDLWSFLVNVLFMIFNFFVNSYKNVNHKRGLILYLWHV